MFSLPELPYAATALAPHMSAETLNFHHGKHHAGYVKNLNGALEQKGWKIDRLEDVIAKAKAEGDKFIFNQSAQIWNHTFFWNSMTANYAAPPAALADALNASFGGFDAFKKQFTEKGAKHFASGWVWLIAKGEKLEVVDTHDAETVVNDPGVTPLLTCDVWEHAYYIDRRNDRAAFLDAFFNNLANWDFAARQYNAARGKGAAWQHPK